MKIIFRIIVLPLWLAIYSLGFLRVLLRSGYYFLRYGGETITYCEEPTKIFDVYEELKRRIK